MSDKMTCPACGTYTSGVLLAYRADEPCPSCGLSAAAMAEIITVRLVQADEALKVQLVEALTKLDRAETELRALREWKHRVTDAVNEP